MRRVFLRASDCMFGPGSEQEEGNLLQRLFASFLFFVTAIFYVLFFASVPWGIYHAFSRHDNTQGFISVFIPPYAWYMTAESFFWHDDFPGVDWDERVGSDIRTGILLLSVSVDPEPSKAAAIDRSIEKFREITNTYPTEQKEKIRQAIRLYIEYWRSFYADTLLQAKAAILEGTRDFELKASPKTIEIENNLRKYRAIDDILEELALAISLMNQKLGQADVPQFSPEVEETLNLIMQAFEVKMQIQTKKMWRIYDKLTASPLPK